MADEPPVARGDRREEVWIEKDRDQVTKVRHTFPTARPPLEEHSEATQEGVSTDDAEVTDAVVMPEESSAWEAREEGDDE